MSAIPNQAQDCIARRKVKAKRTLPKPVGNTNILEDGSKVFNLNNVETQTVPSTSGAVTQTDQSDEQRGYLLTREDR